MNKFKDAHESRKNDVLLLLGVAKDHFEKYNNIDKASSFDSLSSSLKNGYFSIVVVGEFSAGKSTFLNALMHEKYLPSFSSETTATINFLRHKDKSDSGEEEVKVHFNDGSKEIVAATFESIERYTSTKSNIEVVKEINLVELFLDSKFLEKGVMLVDSPGLNGVAEGHKDITEKQIEKSHACIFMFSSEQPGKATDFKLIKELRNKVNTIIFVLNKIDTIKADEQTLEEVINTLKKNYKKELPDEPIPEIWPIAAYPAMVSRSQKNDLDFRGKTQHTEEDKENYIELSKIEVFEDRLWHFLTEGEKAKQELLEPVNRVIKIFETEKNDLKTHIATLNGSFDTDDIQLQINNLEKEIRQMEDEKKKKYDEVKPKIINLVKGVEEEIKSRTQKLIDKYGKEIDGWDDLNNIDEDIQRFLKKIPNEAYSVISNTHSNFIDNFKELAHNNFRDYSSDINKKLEESGDNINFSLDTNIDANFNFDFGYDAYSTQIEKLKGEVESIENEVENLEKNKIKIQLLENQKQELKTKISSAEQSKDTALTIFGHRPPNKLIKETTVEEYYGGGLMWVWRKTISGPKLQTKEYTKIDTSERDNYNDQINDFNKKTGDKINNLKKEMDTLNVIDKSSEEYKILIHQKERLKGKRRDELEQFMNDYRVKFQKENAKELKKIKRKLTDFFEEVEGEIQDKYKKELKKQQENLSKIIIDTINITINGILDSHKKELEIRSHQLNSSIEEKESIIINLEEQIIKIDNILNLANNTFNELENIKINEIILEKV